MPPPDPLQAADLPNRREHHREKQQRAEAPDFGRERWPPPATDTRAPSLCTCHNQVHSHVINGARRSVNDHLIRLMESHRCGFRWAGDRRRWHCRPEAGLDSRTEVARAARRRRWWWTRASAGAPVLRGLAKASDGAKFLSTGGSRKQPGP